MRAFLGTVLSVIAAGVLLIAYGLLAPRAVAAPFGAPGIDGYAAANVYPYQTARPVAASDIVALGPTPAYDPYVASRAPLAYPASDVRQVRTVQRSSASRRANGSK